MKRHFPDSNLQHVGIFRNEMGANVVWIAEKGGRRKVRIPNRFINGACGGDLVLVERLPGQERQAKIVERLNAGNSPTPYSMIAIKAHGIPNEFSDGALAEAEENCRSIHFNGADLTDIPFMTIDPADARDRDDAVCAEPDMDPENPGGHVIWVAVADVSSKVPSGSKLDQEARLRGNSTYFPDFTIPMLPSALCEDACSLNAGVDRQCMAVRMVIDRDGNRLSHEFTRGTMRSRASLHYSQAQSMADGEASRDDSDLVPQIARLWAAFRSLESASRRREPLRIEMPERRILLSGSGAVEGIFQDERLESHRLIEEFMVLANVCAAETIEGMKFRTLRRVHEEPDSGKIAELARTAVSCGLPFARASRTTTGRLNELLDRAKNADCSDHISLAILRSMNQANYSTANAGHFGLNLNSYAHFTSPIRRYADLVVHRTLIGALKLGPDGMTDEDHSTLNGIAGHVSMTERRSVAAEREAHDRFAVQFVADRVGAEFDGTVVGIARQGVFVRLDETGTEGIIRRSDLGFGQFRFNRDKGRLTDVASNKAIHAGLRIRIKLLEAEPLSGTLRFAPVEVPWRRRTRRLARRKERRTRRGGR